MTQLPPLSFDATCITTSIVKHGYAVVPCRDPVGLDAICAGLMVPEDPMFLKDYVAGSERGSGWVRTVFAATCPAYVEALKKLMPQLPEIARAVNNGVRSVHGTINEATNTHDERGKTDIDRSALCARLKPDRYRVMLPGKGPVTRQAIKTNAMKTLHIDNRTDRNGTLEVALLWCLKGSRSMVVIDLANVRASIHASEIFQLLNKARGQTNFWTKWSPEEKTQLEPYMTVVNIPEGHVLVLLQELPHCQTSERRTDTCVVAYIGVGIGTEQQLSAAAETSRRLLRTGDADRSYIHGKSGASRVYDNKISTLVDKDVLDTYTLNGKLTYSPSNPLRNQLPCRKRFREDVLRDAASCPPGKLAKFIDLLDTDAVRCPEKQTVDFVTQTVPF